jgi:streptogramin lyase
MPIRSLLPATIAALLCISLPASGQVHTPDGASKTGTVAPASVRVSFEEWVVPTPRPFPHDPRAAADGAIWYTGQVASTLGRLEPKTGAFKEYWTKTPNSGPHGLAVDKDGNIGFTASFKGYIGKLDPKTGTITEYHLPDPAARDPHTPVFDRTKVLWFTVQGANMKIGAANGGGEVAARAHSERIALRYCGEFKRRSVLR